MITEVIQELNRRGLDYELLPHPRTQTARAEANAVGIEANAVAKTVVLSASTSERHATCSTTGILDWRPKRSSARLTPRSNSEPFRPSADRQETA